MAEPSQSTAGRKRRAESVESDPGNDLLTAAGPSGTLVSLGENDSNGSSPIHKKARLELGPASPILSQMVSVKTEDDPLFLLIPEDGTGSATVSTRASPVEELDEAQEADGATVKAEENNSASAEASTVPTASSSSSKSRKRARLDPEASPQAQARSTNSPAQPIPAGPAPQHEPSLAPSRSILDMPLELLSEILLYTESIQAVLSIAMSCKFFCKTLLQPSSKYIWKYVRENNVPKPPPQFEVGDQWKWGFDEVSYAAFLFGGGICEGCGEHCDKPYVSYAVRLRLCGEQKCEETLIKAKKLRIAEEVYIENNLRGEVALLPYLEDITLLRLHKQLKRDGADSHAEQHVARGGIPDHLRSFLIEERDQPDFRERLKHLRRKQASWMTFCKDIIKWRRAVKNMFYGKKKENDTAGRALAEEFGWNFEDMVHCTDFGQYCRNKNHTFQDIAKGDVAAMAARIEEQLTLLTEKRERRTHEAHYQETRQQILKHYKHLRSTKAFPILPALTAFRRLSVIDVIQSNSGEAPTEAKDVAQSLRTDKTLINLLKAQINAWVAVARTKFGEKVGVKKWKSVNKKELHPAERMTARFKCVRPGCDVVEEGYEEDGCLDFKGACRHECGKMGRKKGGSSWKWSPEMFERDEQASEAVKKYLKLCELEDRFAGTADSVAVLQAANYVLCKSCETPIIMKFNNLIGHSHRHEQMEFVLLQDPKAVEAAIGKKYSFKAGLTRLLVGPGSGKKGQEARGAKVYGCRHCYNKQLADHRQAVEAKKAACAAIQGTSVVEDGPNGEEEPEARMFIFDGLKSHLIEMHEIRNVRDEDWVCAKLPPLLEKAKV